MSAEKMECPSCCGTGQHVEMRSVTIGQPLSPYRQCPRCDGTGEVPGPKPVRVWRRRSLRRV